jgi:hypothetical protein
MTTYPEDIMRAAFEWTAKSYDKDTETWLDVRDNFAAAIMAERQRCADIAGSTDISRLAVALIMGDDE